MHPYEEIRTELLRRIDERTWPAGFTVPHEEKLAAEFGVARGTIRRALTSLVDAGLIERRRKAGTRVVGRKSHSSTLTIPIVRHEIEAKGERYGFRMLSDTQISASDDPRGLFGDAQLRRTLCLHLSDGQPYQLEDRLVSLEAVPEYEQVVFDKLSPNEWLVAQIPFSSVRTTLSATLANSQDQHYLQLSDKDPVFVVERETQRGDLPITFVRMSHPAHSFKMVTLTNELG